MNNYDCNNRFSRLLYIYYIKITNAYLFLLLMYKELTTLEGKLMDFESLNTFITLSKTHNFTQAANRLFIAQSTVTNRINEIEKEIGITLFSRNNRSVELTNAGEKFLVYAQKVLDITDTALSDITKSDKFSETLRIGSSDSIYETHLSELIIPYREMHPEYAVKITIGQSTHLIEQLTDGILDIIFSYLPIKKSNFYCSVFHEDDMTLVTNSNNMLFPHGILRDDLASINYIMCNFALHDVGLYIRGLFPKYHQFSLEIDDCSKIIPFLDDPQTYTFLPKAMAEPYIQENQLREIALLDFKTPIISSYMIANKSKLYLTQQLVPMPALQ